MELPSLRRGRIPEQQANGFVLAVNPTCILMHLAVLEAGLAEPREEVPKSTRAPALLPG